MLYINKKNQNAVYSIHVALRILHYYNMIHSFFRGIIYISLFSYFNKMRKMSSNI